MVRIRGYSTSLHLFPTSGGPAEDLICCTMPAQAKRASRPSNILNEEQVYIANESGQDCKDHRPTWQAAGEAHGVIVSDH